MASQIKDIDRGWKRIKKDVRRMDKSFVKIGLQQNAGRVNGTSLAMIGFWNEFGTRHIPSRSFIRYTADVGRAAYTALAASQADKIIRGKQTIFQALSIIGAKAQADVQRRITTVRTPPNAASTIAKKGSSNPLIHTGRMRSSIRYVVKGAK